MPSVVVAAMALAPLALVSSPAAAIPVDVGWAASGAGVQPGGSDGSQSAASFSYSLDPAGFGVPRSWTFSATASQSGQVKVPYTWQGLHAWFAVTTSLDAFVTHLGSTTPTHLLGQGPTNCCTSPSNGFLYGGAYTFNVQAGDTYGFTLSGSNSDSNNFLQGTFTLSTKPYVDATLAGDNRDWPGAVDPATTDLGKREIHESGEARWFKFPVVPGQNVTVSLTNPSGDDYDLVLYGDIDSAYRQLSGDGDLLAASSNGVPVSSTQVPDYPTDVTTIPDSNQSQEFAPRIYAPRIYAPRIYAPRIYAPRIYAPRIYAPDAYVPDLASDPSFQQAFSAAQNQTLIAVSAKAGGGGTEQVLASSGNTNGYFYVRVQGHGDADFDATHPFTLSVDTGDSGCGVLSDFSDQSLAPTVVPGGDADPATVIVTDTGRMDYKQDANGDSATPAQFLGHFSDLAASTDGVVVDVAGSDRVRALWGQVADQPDCPYAVNLVAAAIDEIVASSHGSAGKYVVIAGGDNVVPFFRYPDVSGLGEESNFSPPMRGGTPANASLAQDQVLSQDAYGSDTDITLGGATLPLPELAVGRLVKTDTEIVSTIDNFVSLGADHTLPTPHSSLVTGYDFLADAAKAVNREFTDALGPDAPAGSADTLISDPADPGSTPWTADQLRSKLLGDTHHDLVFLAGHFSANDTLAADFSTTLNAQELAPDGPNAGKLANTLVLSAGCHSGYNIVDDQAATSETNDWTQRMAQQHAILIGGTGYQYGDSDFLEYSERLYLDIARQLHDGTGTGDVPVRIGQALALAKQDYLAGVTTMTGIDEKALLEATLYGLPMTGLDAPGRTSLGADTAHVDPGPVVDPEPGHTLGLRTIDKHYDTPTGDPLSTNPQQRTPKTKPSGLSAPHPADLTWLPGADGVSIQPGVPALPKQVEDVTPEGDLVLRGVGFIGGHYDDSTGVLPVTGAPAIEGTTPNSTFESDTFFPQRLTTVNYFGALGASGRTSLILTPAQYRTDANPDPDIPTDTQRVYRDLDVRLFYSGSAGGAAGGNQPKQAAPPGISNVQGTYQGNQVTISATVAGDPSAGVQQAWVTWTGTGTNSGHGTWTSVDLTQSATDSTRWSRTFALPAGQLGDGLKFIVQAANGAGVVSLDAGDGDGYGLDPAGAASDSIFLVTHATSAASPFGVTAGVVDGQGVGVSGRTVRFSVYRAGALAPLYSITGVSTSSGAVELTLPPGKTSPPAGPLHVVADLLNASNGVQDSDNVDVTVAGAAISISATSPAYLEAPAGQPYPAGTPLTATVSDQYTVLSGAQLTMAFPTPLTVPTASFVGVDNTRFSSFTTTTGSSGTVTAPPAVAGTVNGAFVATISAAYGTATASATVPMANQYAYTAFGSPVSSVVTTNTASNTPIKLGALLSNGSALSDAAAALLVKNGLVQVRWRVGTGVWDTRPNLVTYDTKSHTFQAGIKPGSVGMSKNNDYTVQLRVLAGPPTAASLQSDYDLGGRSFTLKVR